MPRAFCTIQEEVEMELVDTQVHPSIPMQAIYRRGVFCYEWFWSVFLLGKGRATQCSERKWRRGQRAAGGRWQEAKVEGGRDGYRERGVRMQKSLHEACMHAPAPSSPPRRSFFRHSHAGRQRRVTCWSFPFIGADDAFSFDHTTIPAKAQQQEHIQHGAYKV